MPEREVRRRGGAKRVRTIRLGKDAYAHVYVVPKAGTRGGHTVLGEVKHTKKRRAAEEDRQPSYKIKRQPIRRQRRNHGT